MVASGRYSFLFWIHPPKGQTNIISILLKTICVLQKQQGQEVSLYLYIFYYRYILCIYITTSTKPFKWGIYEVKELSTVHPPIYSYRFSFSLCKKAGFSMGGKSLLPAAQSVSLGSQKHRGRVWVSHSCSSWCCQRSPPHLVFSPKHHGCSLGSLGITPLTERVVVAVIPCNHKRALPRTWNHLVENILSQTRITTLPFCKGKEDF